MARRAPTLPISWGEGADPDLTAITDNWQRIEEAYNTSLSSGVRKEILDATSKFVLFEAAERTAEPRKNSAKWIEDCKKANEAFGRALTAGDSDADRFAQYLVKKNFAEGESAFSELVSHLPNLNAACDFALKELSDPSMPSFRKGRAWGRWIRELTKVSRNNSLPFGVSKDEGRKSRFIDLVWELQKHVPAECRRHMQSKPALAKGILNERTRPKRQAAAKASAAEGTNSPLAKIK